MILPLIFRFQCVPLLFCVFLLATSCNVKSTGVAEIPSQDLPIELDIINLEPFSNSNQIEIISYPAGFYWGADISRCPGKFEALTSLFKEIGISYFTEPGHPFPYLEAAGR